MKGTSQPVYRHPLVGVWSNPFLSAQWTVSLSNGRLVVTGVDRDRGAKFKVSKVSWTRKTVRFKSVYPPTGRVVFHECRSLSRSKMKDILTYEVREVWVRSSSGETVQERLIAPISRSKLAPLVGVWHNPSGEDFRILCTITLKNGRLRICAEDVGDGEQLQVHALRWNGQVLTFTTKVVSTGQVCHRIFKPISTGKMRATLRIREAFAFERLPSKPIEPT